MELAKAENTGKDFDWGCSIFDFSFQFRWWRRGGGATGNREAKIENQGASADDGLAAGLLELGLGGTGELLRGDLEGAADFAVAEDLEQLDARADEAGGGEHLGVHLGDLGIEAGEIADVDDRILSAELVVVEAAVRELAVEGHLAAFEARADGTAGATLLALATDTGGLAVAAAFAATDALLAVHSTLDVNEIMETHFLDS